MFELMSLILNPKPRGYCWKKARKDLHGFAVKWRPAPVSPSQEKLIAKHSEQYYENV